RAVLELHFVEPLVTDLGFVATPKLSRQTPEEDAAIEPVAVGNDVELEDKIIPLPFGLEVARPIFDIELAFLCDSRLGLGQACVDLLPACEVFAIENSTQVGGANPDVPHRHAFVCVEVKSHLEGTIQLFDEGSSTRRLFFIGSKVGPVEDFACRRCDLILSP